jgi:pimeloyl-ACP methyl ester carboxylesterase
MRPIPRPLLPTLLLTAALAGCAGTPPGTYNVREVGSFHVGGRQATLTGLPEREISFSAGMPPIKVNPNGDFEVEQMYVQYVLLANPKAKYPLLLVHGGGLSGVTWETKPDGKPGWQQFFLQAGHDVYVSDAVERGRASWARYPEVFKSEPMFRTKKEAWELFRIGLNGSYDTDPAKRRTVPGGSLFPIEAFDQFGKQGVPRWASNDPATQAAYDAYVQKVCPCVIITHSQGGNFGFTMALHAPDKVKALISIEPSGSPDPDKTDLKPLKGVPMLFMWGDNHDLYPFWQGVRGRLGKFHDALAAQGEVADVIDLPKAGIKGNSHMLMMDRNSDQTAQMVQDWITKQGLMK